MKNSKVLCEELAQGKYSQLLKEIYIDESMVPYQQERYIKAVKGYEEIFGENDVEIYSAPGRSEVGGIIQIISMVWCLLHPLTWMLWQW